MSGVRAPKTPITPEQIRECELYGVLLKSGLEPQALSDQCIQEKLFAAEDYYERMLGIVLGERRFFSDPAKRSPHPRIPQLSIPDYDPTRDIAEPSYDYPLALWAGERWAAIKLRHKPVIRIDNIFFTWAASVTIWQVPHEWIQVDRRGGTVNIIPASGPAVLISFSAYILTIIAGGRGLPHSILIDGAVGIPIDELCRDYAELLEAIRLRAMLSLLGPIGNIISLGGQNQSLSLDGLSHSRGYGGRWGAYSGYIELLMDREKQLNDHLRDKIRGPAVEFTA